MLKYKFQTLFLVVTSFFYSSFSYAKVEGFNIDGLIGADFVTGGLSSGSSNLGYGLRLGYHLDPSWEIGVGYTLASSSSTIANTATSSNTGLLMGDVAFHLNGEWNPLYFGLRLGAGFNSGTIATSSVANSGTTSNFAYGLLGGYDFKVADSSTIGPRVSYTMMNQATNNLGDFQAHAAFKYFF